MLDVYSYSIPFRRPFVTGAGSFSNRKGTILVFSNQDENCVAEASPLTGFSSDSQEQILTAVSSLKSQIDNFFKSDFSADDLKVFTHKTKELPSLQFALSYMGTALLNQRRDEFLPTLFGKKPSADIKVNYTIGGGAQEEVLRELKHGFSDGYRTFKFKALWPVDKLIRLLNETAAQFPDIHIRLDANRSWPEHLALKTLEEIRHLPIEYVEEPSAFDSMDSFISFAEQCPIPLAADESLTAAEDTLKLIRASNQIIPIVKPTLLGSILRLKETFSEFRSPFNNQSIVFTTALESGIGRHMVASVAAFLGSPGRAHGLSTGRFFKTDLIDGPYAEKGLLSPDFRPFGSLDLTLANTKLLKPIK